MKQRKVTKNDFYLLMLSCTVEFLRQEIFFPSYGCGIGSQYASFWE